LCFGCAARLKNCPLCEGQIVSWDPLQRLEDVSPRFDTLGCLEDQESDPFIAKSNTKKRCKKLIPQNSGGEDYSMGDGFRSDDDKMPTWLVHSKAEGEGLDGVGDVTEVNSENQGAWPADEKFQAPNEGGEVNGETFVGLQILQELNVNQLPILVSSWDQRRVRSFAKSQSLEDLFLNQPSHLLKVQD
jgi:hypothetical protein